jgi:hypothetical protein
MQPDFHHGLLRVRRTIKLSTTEDTGDAEEKFRFDTGLNLLSSVSPVVAR